MHQMVCKRDLFIMPPPAYQWHGGGTLIIFSNMRTELAAFDLHHLTKEFQILVNAKIDKIYQDNDTFVFQLHIPNKGKKYLKIIQPKFIILEEEKYLSVSDKFALSLRKHISNTRIRKIEQLEFERILRFELESKDNKYNLQRSDIFI